MGPSASDLQRCDGDLPPGARLDFAPARADRTRYREGWLGRAAAEASLASLLHAAFLAGFVVVVTWSERTLEPPHEIPVEIVARVPGEATPPSPTRMPGAPGPNPAAAAPLPSPVPPSAPGAAEPPPVAAAAPPPPALVAPPPEPPPAAARTEKPVVANTEPERTTTDPVRAEPPPADAPKVLATHDEHAFAVPPRAEPSPKPPPPRAAAANPEPDPGAILAAALPTNLDALPASFRAVLSAAGAQDSPQYKGLVFGRLGRSHDIMERARAQHLRGQAVVAFSIDDAGAIAGLSIVQSSGNAALDGLALELVRAAGPFPPPPPGAQRNFTPALTFGE